MKRTARKASRTPDRDRDRAILATLVGVVDRFDRTSILNGLPAREVRRWLRKRVVFYIAARAEGLTD